MKRRAALLAACGAWAAWPLRAASAPDSTSRPRVPDARLTDQDGRSRSLRALCDRPVVIGFFYTGCSTVCPPQTAALRALRERLDAQAGAPVARMLQISVDPLGDSPQALRAYADRFEVQLGLDAGWLMLTGQPADLKPVWTAFGVPVGDPEGHSALLWIGSQAGGRWTRAAALTPTTRLVELVKGVAT